MLTAHALKRMQQRGITPLAIKNAILYGIERMYSDTIIFHLGKKAAKKIAKKEGVDLNGSSDLKVVVNDRNEIITAYHCKH